MGGFCAASCFQVKQLESFLCIEVLHKISMLINCFCCFKKRWGGEFKTSGIESLSRIDRFCEMEGKEGVRGVREVDDGTTDKDKTRRARL